MSAVEIGRSERWCLLDEHERGDPLCLIEGPLEHAVLLVAQGKRLGLYVDGWTAPWPVTLEDGVLRARCPTASVFVRPAIVEARHEGQ